jgi:lipoprotein NlpD
VTPRRPDAGRRLLLALVVLAWSVGCAQPGRPPVAERSPVFGAPDSYVVQPGDTLYSIAWRFGLDPEGLARANGIRAPYTIYVGQRIRLVVEAPVASRAPPPAVSSPPAAAVSGWRPPTDAPVGRGYGQGNKGVDYVLEPRHRVCTAAAGEVVYAGSGLGGFRHLVIVRHGPQYLSAYSLDRAVIVREGQGVQAGALLADMEEAGRRAGTLHFEIRKDGAPVDPRSLIGR